MQAETLDKKAAGVAATLVDKLLGPYSAMLTTFESAFPGITERLSAVVDPEKLKEAFTAEVAKSIKSLMEQGTEDSLTAAIGKVRELRGLVAGSTAHTQEGIQTLITQAGGIFIGHAELLRLGKIKDTDVVPAIPEKYSKEFFEATHPIRGGTIASHCILGFDVESKQWLCIDRGEGGASDIVPGSLGADGQGLSGDKQDEILKKIAAVSGCKIESPKDSNPIERILNAAIDLHFKNGKSIETAPFRGIYGRTADEKRGASGCRVLLGVSNEDGVDVSVNSPGDAAYYNVGLLAAWN